ncbi:TetR family transcriptional regulator [Kutzneria viridogrisea]|uniref:AcrR family transcriptional regulator n=1 Tax=Kutzneria viridogrisea TaxID=47990 RepID=A0ABR6BDG2_9PSEU|nr:AcrR family transcriptional regulator [Kutzneria viridogrisea]
MEESGPGLRERKKAATREALSWAAVRLTVQRGLDNVLVEDIANEVGVSSRTFNNYFASKADAITWRHLNRMRQILATLRERPADEPVWQSATEAVLAHSGEEDVSPDPQWTAGVKVMMSDPGLQGAVLRAVAVASREFAEVIAERTGTDVRRDLYPALVAAAIGAASQVAQDRWVHADPPVPLVPLLREAMAQFGAGLQRPPG